MTVPAILHAPAQAASVPAFLPDAASAVPGPSTGTEAHHETEEAGSDMTTVPRPDEPGRNRDYVAEMDAIIAMAVPAGDWVATVVSYDIVTELSRKDPDLLAGWLRAYAVTILARRISEQARSARSLQRARASARAFDAAVSEADGGNLAPLRSFATSCVVDALNTHRRVADMTGADHEYVASRHHRRGTTDLMLAAFHRAIAARLGDRRTSEVFTEAEYASLWQQLSS
jgi:hypothetical protein